ncbi:Emp65p [Sporobolomyces salmoneus]|uniref:Emp65p n=1 Tax=Sporobolomyces salmoneus TaxID=183962 RepID=UPI0031822FAB
MSSSTVNGNGYQFPQTQSLPDLGLFNDPESPDDDRTTYRYDSSAIQPPLQVSTLDRPGNGLNGREFDEDDDEMLSLAPPEREVRRTTSRADLSVPPLPLPMPLSRTPSRHPSSEFQRVRSSSSSSRRSSTSSTRRSSISSLGSIHSAPELLLSTLPTQAPISSPSLSSTLPPTAPTPQAPLPVVQPPPELTRNSSSQKGKRQSIAVMERRRSELKNTETLRRQEEEVVASPGDLTAADETEEDRALERKGTGKTRRRRRKREFPNTLWEYLKQEVLTVEVDGEEGIKSERVTNFLTVPKELEKIIFFGFIICLDAFLYTFTILPLRSICSLFSLVSNHLSTCIRWRPRTKGLKLSQKCDLIKMVIVVITVVGLHRVTDASKMYHGVRGQETIKLYVLFNVLEIADRLCCSFGQDLSDSLFSSSALSPSTRSLSSSVLRPVSLFTLYTLYVISHSLVLFYQLVTLNVAVNSYSNALLTLLLSNQFVEIKGSVFKKFEKENLFQLTCADIVERFQLALMLFIISLRNLLENSTSISTLTTTTTSSSLSSTSSTLFPLDPTLLLTTFSPALTVLISECFVDWLKHAFITKFNHIRPKVYGRYMDVLCKDLIKGQAGNMGSTGSSNLIDQSPSVSRRLGFAALPLSCLVIRVSFQAFRMLGDESGLDECLIPPNQALKMNKRNEGFTLMGFGFGLGGGGFVEKGMEEAMKWAGIGSICLGVWICLITLKLLIGINLRTFASERWNGIEKMEREEEDYRNGKSRGGIGVSKSEAIETDKTNKLLRDKQFDQPSKASLSGGAGGKDKIELEDLGRYDMVRSRLW